MLTSQMEIPDKRKVMKSSTVVNGKLKISANPTVNMEIVSEIKVAKEMIIKTTPSSFIRTPIST